MRTFVAIVGLSILVGCNEQPPVKPVATTATVVKLDENVALGVANGESTTEFNEEKYPTAEFKVPGLHCVNCSETACNLVLDIEGVEQVKADSVSKVVTVAFSSQDLDREAVSAKLTDTFGAAPESDESSAVTEEEPAEDSESE